MSLPSWLCVLVNVQYEKEREMKRIRTHETRAEETKQLSQGE